MSTLDLRFKADSRTDFEAFALARGKVALIDETSVKYRRRLWQ